MRDIPHVRVSANAVVRFTSEILSGVSAAHISYMRHMILGELVVSPEIVSADNNTCFTRGFWKFVGVITRLLISSTTHQTVLGSESCS